MWEPVGDELRGPEPFGAMRGGLTERCSGRERQGVWVQVPVRTGCQGKNLGGMEGAAGGGAPLMRHPGKRPMRALGLWAGDMELKCIWSVAKATGTIGEGWEQVEVKQERTQGNLGLWGHDGETASREVGVGRVRRCKPS